MRWLFPLFHRLEIFLRVRPFPDRRDARIDQLLHPHRPLPPHLRPHFRLDAGWRHLRLQKDSGRRRGDAYQAIDNVEGILRVSLVRGRLFFIIFIILFIRIIIP